VARKSLRSQIEQAADRTAGADEPASQIQDFLDCMAKYAKEFEKWEKRAEKVLKRYRDEGRENRTTGEAKFNILWSNVQTLIPATFSKLPKPDVSRRFKDQDPVGRVASMLLERGLEFEIDHYTDYRSTMRQCVMDRFLGGRGTAWIRYEPHFKAQKKDTPEDGVQVTEDTDEAPVQEAIDYECAPVDYVHWRDFGHDVARTWEEVTKVWRNVYMSEEAVQERFPKAAFPKLYDEDGKLKLPMDATPEKTGRQDKSQQETQKKQALIIELWDKQTGCAYWFSKSMKAIIDEQDDPLGLQDFFPCPRPLYSTLTNDTLVPVPDFTLYQDQANELDVLADRIDGLAKMLQLKGVYDASIPELARLFTEGENGTLIPGKNWAAFAEKNGLKGSLQLVDLQPIAQALAIAAETMEQVKGQVYEITGISDIIRGQTSASETATAQQIKGQYASLRLRSMQDEVARFATECLQLKAQVICGKFAPATIAAIAAADQLSEADKPMVYVQAPVPQPIPGVPPVPPPPPSPTGPAMALLIGQQRLQDPEAESPNPMRSFRIEVAADTLVQLDEEAEKKSRMEFVTATGTFLEKALPVMQSAPQAAPFVMELLGFGIRGFKIGKGIEGQFDAMIDKLKQAAANPQPAPPDPAVVKAQMDKASEDARLAHEQQVAQIQAQAQERESQLEHQREMEKVAAEAKRAELESYMKEREAHRQEEFERWKAELDARTKIEIAEIAATATLDAAQMKAAEAASDDDPGTTGETGASVEKPPKRKIARKTAIDKLADMHAQTMEAHGRSQEQSLQAHTQTADAIKWLAEKMSARRSSRIIRDPNTGKAIGVESVE